MFCNVGQVMWTFSLFLEAVAILPQLVLLQRTRNIDNLTGQYVFLLGYVDIPDTYIFGLPRHIRFLASSTLKFFSFLLFSVE